MTISMTNALECFKVLQRLEKEKLPIKVAYKLTKLFLELEKEIECYEKIFKSIILDYAKKDELNNPIVLETKNGETEIQISEENQEICLSKINELNNMEINLNNYIFSLDDLNSINFSLNDLKAFFIFIEDSEK